MLQYIKFSQVLESLLAASKPLWCYLPGYVLEEHCIKKKKKSLKISTSHKALGKA